MVENASAYVRTAASMSPTAYEAFLAEREGDWQYDRLASYRATSVDAQRLRDEISALREQQARQTVASEVVGRVDTQGTSWIGATLDWLEGARAILLSLVMDLVCLIMPWIALRLEQARAQQLQGAPMAAAAAPSPLVDEDHMIPDLRGQEPVVGEVEAYFEDLKEKRSRAAKQGWMKRKMRVTDPKTGRSWETEGAPERASEGAVLSAGDPRKAAPPTPEPDIAGAVGRIGEAAGIAAGLYAIADIARQIVLGADEEDDLDAWIDDVELPDGEGVMVREGG
jgi:hypothetical protein